MSARVAKKILSFPVGINEEPHLSSPYSKAQLERAARAYRKALKRTPEGMPSKWGVSRPKVWRRHWTPGRTGEAVYQS